MKTQRVTLQDIATRAGVTKMTVSRYLRMPDKVAPDTATRIAQVMEELDYRNGDENQASAEIKNACIGILVPSFHNHIFSALLAGIESVAKAHGYQTLVVNSDYQKEREEEQIIQLLSYDIAGLILTESVHTLRTEKYLNAAGIPIAQLMDNEPQPNRIIVGFNNRQAAYDMTDALLARGRRHIVYFGSMSDNRDQKRYQGYADAMENAGLPARKISPHTLSSMSVGASMLSQARQMYPQIDAIFCTNDDIAVGVLQECLRLRISVPQAIAVAGFHGLDIGSITTPSLASVVTPRFDIGKVATEILIKKIENIPTADYKDLHYRISPGGTM